MKNLMQIYKVFVKSCAKVDWLPALLARISIGSIFAISGWGKIHNLAAVTEFFTELGIPFPGFHAGFVSLVELVGGVLLIMGLLTRLSAIPLIITMVVAIITAKASEIGSIGDFLGLDEFVYIGLLFYLVIQGAQKISVDYLLKLKIDLCSNR